MAETHAWLTWSRSPEAFNDSERFWFRAYGIAYHVFRVLGELGVIFGGGYLTVEWYGPTGAVTFVLILIWFRDMFLKGTVMKLLTFPWWLRFGGSTRVRWLVRGLYIVVIVGIGFIPYKHEICGNCRVLPAKQVSVRAQVADEIVKVSAFEGSVVSPGDRIVTLAGRKVKEEVAVAEANVAEAKAELDKLLNGNIPQEIDKAEQDVETAEVHFHAAVQELQRSARLLQDKVITDKDFEQKEREKDMKQAELGAAREVYSKMLEGPRRRKSALPRPRSIAISPNSTTASKCWRSPKSLRHRRQDREPLYGRTARATNAGRGNGGHRAGSLQSDRGSRRRRFCGRRNQGRDGREYSLRATSRVRW